MRFRRRPQAPKGGVADPEEPGGAGLSREASGTIDGMGSGFLSPLHLFILLILLLLLFGAKRLPEIGRSLGTGMREFKDSVTSSTPDKVETHSELPPPVAAPPVASVPVPVQPAAVPEPAAGPERETEPVS
jgi:sec-independent protein translocase protein TatA